MRRRSTFIHDPGSDFNPAEISINGQHLSFSGLKAAREERLTYSFKDLPVELLDVLQQSRELHIKWNSPYKYDRAVPFLSSLTPGLHIQYEASGQQENDLICPLLRRLFSKELKCVSVQESFTNTSVTSSDSTLNSSWQYYSPLPSTQQLVAYLQRDVCSRTDLSCFHTVALLNVADYIDFDYQDISHELTITAFWSKPPAVLYDPIGEWTTFDHWNLAIEGLPTDNNEVGILGSASASDPHDLQLEGFLTVVGEDTEPSPTMFFFPSRHHVLPSTQAAGQAYSVSFLPPTGLHPTLQISFLSASALIEPPTTKPRDSTCGLYTYVTLPSAVFADEYAFASDDRLFFDAHHLHSLRSISGELDLEAPDYVVSKWGSAMLLELATPSSSPPTSSTTTSESSWNVTIPLHLRYLEPSPGGISEIDVPWPVVFWACSVDSGDVNFAAGNPFDRTHLGYDSLFDDGTMFYHLTPSGTELVERIRVPVLNMAQTSSRTVEIGTLVAIVLGFAWILKALLPGLVQQVEHARESPTATEKSRSKSEKKEKKKQ